MTASAPPVVITCGEPAGIGPEIAAQAWRALKDSVPMVWLGDPRHLPGDLAIEMIQDTADAARLCPHALPVIQHGFARPSVPGTADPANARGVIDVIARAVDMVQTGAGAAICTAPIHKQALIEGAGFAYPGHTEYLAELAGGQNRAVMMLASDQLRVVPTTIHIALADVPSVLTPALLRETIEITHHALVTQFGIPDPRIAVAGLNPHAGEGGVIGTEEGDWINALVADFAATGMKIVGPLPADTMFHAAARARYDAAVAMYHDQALIPIKTLDFDRGVNVTLGLPFVRTSPDHGTAFDIAGKGVANATSMIEAIKLAHEMSGHV